MSIARAMWVLLGIFSCGCGTKIQYAEINPPPRFMLPRDASSVAVFETGVPNRPYTEVGILSSRQASTYSTADMQDIVNAMRARAAKIGCDAIVITGSDKVVVGSSSSVDGTGSGSVQTLEGIKGVCIVYNSAEAATAASAPAPAEDAKPAESKPSEATASTTKPNGAAGFSFGQPLDAVHAVCTGARHQWAQLKGSRYSCSGTPKSVGIPATLVLRFCQNRLCEVNVDPQPRNLRESFQSIQTALARKYGDAKKATEDVPDDCTADQLAKCVADARATLISEWWWDTGERITAKVIASEADGTATLRITYSKWPLDPPEPPKGEGL